MKRKSILASALLFSLQAVYADYSIDLRNTQYPKLNPIIMGTGASGENEIGINSLYMTVGSKPVLPVTGEMHYSRTNPRYWRDTLRKMKASGVDIVSTYCLWSLHEEKEGEMSWDGHLNLREFIKICGEEGLKVHLRIGPYCNAEIFNGGLPTWLVNNKNLRIRYNDPLYLAYVDKWYAAVADQVNDLLDKDGGPVYAIQIENEYVTKGHIVDHLTTLKRMACKHGLDVPLYSMTHWLDVEFPRGEIVPFAGFYIEAPWTTKGKEEMPTTNFEFFSIIIIVNTPS